MTCEASGTSLPAIAQPPLNGCWMNSSRRSSGLRNGPQGHRRPDVTDRKVRFWPVGSYLVVYRADSTPLQIAAILHGARDVPTVLLGR
jgi:hypothetical protein